MRRREDLRRIFRLRMSVMPSAEDPRLSNVEGLLRCSKRRHRHRGSILLSVEVFLYLRKMVWTWASHDTVSSIGGTGKDGDNWKATARFYDSGVGFVTFQQRMVEVEHQRYTIFSLWADPCVLFKSLAEAVSKPEGLPEKTLGYLHVQVLSTFIGETKLWAGARRTLRSPLLNLWYPKEDERANGKWQGRYSYTLTLLMEALQNP